MPAADRQGRLNSQPTRFPLSHLLAVRRDLTSEFPTEAAKVGDLMSLLLALVFGL
jgi:hypothetical protein